ncbi:MAG: hypothetical protein Q8L52_02650 [bacterium]|nr:hypothetical protein [bacterium]
MKDLTQEEAGRWMAAAPAPVQDTVASPATEQVLVELGQQYGLHVDVVGLLVKFTSYMLLGYAGPDAFRQELRAAGVAEAQAQQIIDEINKKIFIPLRERMQKPAEVKLPQPATPGVGVPSHAHRPAVAFGAGGPRPVAPRQPMGIMKPPPQSPMYSNVGRQVPSPGFVQRPSVVPQPMQQQPIVAIRPPASTIAPLPPKVILPRSGVSAETPLGQVLRAVVPPANLPGAMPPSDIIPPRPPTPIPPRTAGTDPYRESVE